MSSDLVQWSAHKKSREPLEPMLAGSLTAVGVSKISFRPASGNGMPLRIINFLASFHRREFDQLREIHSQEVLRYLSEALDRAHRDDWRPSSTPHLKYPSCSYMTVNTVFSFPRSALQSR